MGLDLKNYWLLIVAITLMVELVKKYIPVKNGKAVVHPKWTSLIVAILLSYGYTFTRFFDGHYFELLISFSVSMLFYDYIYKIARNFIIARIDTIGKKPVKDVKG